MKPLATLCWWSVAAFLVAALSISVLHGGVPSDPLHPFLPRVVVPSVVR